MIPLFKVGMSDLAADSVVKVLNSGFIGQGTVVEQFEDTLWKVLKSKTRPVTVNSCTAAIDLSLDIIGIKPSHRGCQIWHTKTNMTEALWLLITVMIAEIVLRLSAIVMGQL